MSFETPSNENVDPRKAYLADLEKEAHILEVTEGEAIDPNSLGVRPNAPDEFLISETLNSIIRYLNLPTIQDDFEDHVQRIAWYNSSGLFNKHDSRLYLENKLRLNKIIGPASWLQHLVSSRTKRKFGNESFFESIEPRIHVFEQTLQEYGKGPIEKNVTDVELFTQVLKEVLEALIKHGYVETKSAS